MSTRIVSFEWTGISDIGAITLVVPAAEVESRMAGLESMPGVKPGSVKVVGA